MFLPNWHLLQEIGDRQMSRMDVVVLSKVSLQDKEKCEWLNSCI